MNLKDCFIIQAFIFLIPGKAMHFLKKRILFSALKHCYHTQCFSHIGFAFQTASYLLDSLSLT